MPRLHCSVTSTTQFQPTPVVVTKGERYASNKRATRCSVGMVTKKIRIPKKGDRVAVTGREGSYVVFLVDESLQVADLKQTGGDERLATIRWDTLAFLDEKVAR